MEIIEVDQFTSTGDMRERDFDTLALTDIQGEGAETARALFGGCFKRKAVGVNTSPSIGFVWFRKGPDGKCELYKSNYDTSD